MFWGRTGALRPLQRAADRLRPQHQELRDGPQREPAVRRPARGTTSRADRDDPAGARLGRRAPTAGTRTSRSFGPGDVEPRQRAGGSTTRPTSCWPPSTSTDGFAHADQLARSSAEVPRRVRRPRPGLPGPRDVHPGAAHRPPGRRRTTASRSSARTCCTTSSTRWCCTCTASRWRAAGAAALRLPGGPGTDRGRQAVLVRRRPVEFRTDRRPVDRAARATSSSTVDFTGIGQVPRPPYPAPDDTHRTGHDGRP